MFIVIMEIPEKIFDKIPSMLIPLVYTPLVVVAAKYLQGQQIEQTLTAVEGKEHWWKALVVGLFGAAVTLIIVLVLAIGEPLFPGQKIMYGPVQNEIFVADGTDKKYADLMYYRLWDLGYFNDDFVQSAYLEKGENSYKIILYIDQEFWDNPEVAASLDAFKEGMEAETGKTVLLYMRHADLSGEKDKLLE